MKKFLATMIVGMSLATYSFMPALAKFPIKAGDIVPVVFFCSGSDAANALRRSVETSREMSEEVMDLQDIGACAGGRMPFPATVAEVTGFFNDWEGDEFALIRVVAEGGPANMYTIVWSHHVAQSGQSV